MWHKMGGNGIRFIILRKSYKSVIDVIGTKCRPRPFDTKLKISRQSQMIEKWMKLFLKIRDTIEAFIFTWSVCRLK